MRTGRTLEPSAIGPRIRAAIAYAGRTIDDVAAEMGFSGKTLKRTINGERRMRPEEKRMLAEILDVPRCFLDEGFSGGWQVPMSAGAAAQRLQVIRRLRAELENEERWLEGRLDVR